MWKNKESYAVEDGLEGLTEKESLLNWPLIGTLLLRKCLGMMVNGDSKWVRLDYEASSLYSVIADGQYRETSAGRATWMSLITGSSLQPHCNQEGFNLGNNNIFLGRIGLCANNEYNCYSCDSWIGFGVYYEGCSTKRYQTCGNQAVCGVYRVVNIPAFGYLSGSSFVYKY